MEVKKKMEGQKMATVESNQRWKKENTVLVSLRLQRKTETDIIDALQNGDGSMQSRLRHLLRLGIQYEQMLKEQNK